MINIAVVGFTNLKEFRAWTLKQLDRPIINNNGSVATTEDNRIAYHCITCANDINGRSFDGMIDCDPLREYVRMRIRGGGIPCNCTNFGIIH